MRDVTRSEIIGYARATRWGVAGERRSAEKMATFIMLSRLSPEGMKTLRNNPERIQEVNEEVEGLGARVVTQYALLGHYDFITVLEAPDAETASRVSVELGSRATATYETLAAIPVDEFASRLREGGGLAGEARRPIAEPPPTVGPMEGTTAPAEGATPGVPPMTEERPLGTEGTVPPRTEEVPPREEAVTGDLPPRTEEAPPLEHERARQPKTEREEDRGLIDRARDALLGEEERGRERTDRPDRR